MFKCTKVIWLLALMPVFASAAYDVNFDYNGSQDYVKDARGECTGEHFLLGDLGALDQNACESACDARSLCTGYSFKSGSCMLKKNITLCSAQDWKTTTGYEYFSKPLELDFVISTQITTLKPTMLTDAVTKSPIKYCLQVPAKAKEGDKLETVKCTSAQGHKGQTYTIEEVAPATNPKTYKIKHLESGLCVDLLEFLVDDNPTRLWNCNLSAETLVRQQRQHFKFQSVEIPKGMENYTPFKVRLNTTHDLSTVSDYFMISTGSCAQNTVLSKVANKTPDECAQECNKVTECKGISYNYTSKSCDLIKDATDCTTRTLGDTYFYTKKLSL